MTPEGTSLDRAMLYAVFASLAVHFVAYFGLLAVPVGTPHQVVNALDIQLASVVTPQVISTSAGYSDEPHLPDEAKPNQEAESDIPASRAERTDRPPPSEVATSLELVDPTPTNTNPQTDHGRESSSNALVSIDINDVRKFIGSNVSLEVQQDSIGGTVEAQYKRQWHKRVQRIGQLNYPASAIRQRISGRLTLQVAINNDGTLGSVSMLESSGHDALDVAALNIVRQTAPYDPLPPNIHRTNGQYRFQSTWEFRR